LIEEITAFMLSGEIYSFLLISHICLPDAKAG